MSVEPKFIDKVAWTPVRDRGEGAGILFARSRDNTLFYTVGGRREEGESDEDTLIREVFEETGGRIIRETIRHIETFEGIAYGHPEGTMLRLACYEAYCTNEDELAPRTEVRELRWFTTDDLERTTPTGQEVLTHFMLEGHIR